MKIESRETASLRVHPALKHIPALEPESAEFLAIAAVHAPEGGQDAPHTLAVLNIDGDGRVLDDTSRTLLAVAKRWQHETVAVRVWAEEELHGLVIRDLAGRRHFSKSAIALLLLPHFESAVEVGKRARLEKLKNAKNPNVSRGPTNWPTRPEEFAASVGISTELLRQARVVRTIFEDDKLYKFGVHGGERDGTIERLTLKAYFEPRLLKHFAGGEHEHTRPLGLGSVIREAEIVRQGKSFVGEDRPDRTEEQLQFWTDPLKSVRTRFARWDALSVRARQHAVEAWQALIKQLPEDLLDTTIEIIERKRRAGEDA